MHKAEYVLSGASIVPMAGGRTAVCVIGVVDEVERETTSALVSMLLAATEP